MSFMKYQKEGNGTRANIYGHILQRPFLTASEIVAELTSSGHGTSYSTLLYHIEKMLAGGRATVMLPEHSDGIQPMEIIKVVKSGNKALFVANNNAYTDEECRTIAATLPDEARRIYLEMRHAKEDIFRQMLAEKHKVSTTTINWHLKRLEGEELVLNHVDELNKKRTLLTANPAKTAIFDSAWQKLLHQRPELMLIPITGASKTAAHENQ